MDETNQVGSKDIPDGMIGISSKFAVINKLITRDLNNDRTNPTFTVYSKDDISKYLSDPRKYEKELRKAITYIYGASPHFRRLIQYFTGLTDFAYIVSPYRIDPKTANVRMTNKNYRKVLNLLSSMSIKTQFPKMLTVCFREDVFYGTIRPSADSIIIQQLPADYCAISTIENNVLNVSFNFSYFDIHPEILEYYPEEFIKKYRIYQKNIMNKWIELDAPYSFALKFNDDILNYALPPFVGVLREIYDLEDYKAMKLAKTAIENYALLAMKLPMTEDGQWGIDYDKAVGFWRNLDAVMPEEVGSVLTPMDIDKISFEKSNTGDVDTIADAEQNLFSAAGVSSLLFNNEKASANALMLSIKVDQEMTFSLVRGIEDILNRYIQYQSFGKNFKVSFLNVSTFNRKEMGDAYLKAASYGLPTISAYAASQGIGQAELDAMSFLETEVLELQEMFVPIQNSNTASSDSNSKASEEEENGGRPRNDDDSLSENGENSREHRDDWG